MILFLETGAIRQGSIGLIIRANVLFLALFLRIRAFFLHGCGKQPHKAVRSGRSQKRFAICLQFATSLTIFGIFTRWLDHDSEKTSGNIWKNSFTSQVELVYPATSCNILQQFHRFHCCTPGSLPWSCGEATGRGVSGSGGWLRFKNIEFCRPTGRSRMW